MLTVMCCLLSLWRLLHLLLPGDFINAFLTFIFVIATLYFCVVIPL
jgi:hypothetical protein